MSDPQTWTMVWGLTLGVVGGLGGGWQKGKNWDNYNRTTIIKNLSQMLASSQTIS